MADQAGLNIKVVTFKEAKDPDELVKLDPQLWRKAVENAVPFYDYIISSSLEKNDTTSPDGGRKIVAETAKFIFPIDNLIVRNHYLKLLAKKLGVTPEVLDLQLEKEFRKLNIPRQPQTDSNLTTTLKNRNDLLEEFLLSLLLQSPQPSDYLLLISPRLKPEDFTNPSLGKIYSLMVSLIDAQKFDIKNFVSLVPPETVDLIDRLYLQDNGLRAGEDSLILEELQKTVWEIKDLTLREKLKEASKKIATNPESEDLKSNFAEITSSLQKLFEEKKLLGLKK